MTRGLGFVLALAIGGPLGQVPASPSVVDLAWLAGCWASLDAEPGSGEQWTAPAGGTLLGMSRTVKQGRTVAHEFVLIRDTAPGKIAFIAHPSEQDAATFTLAEIGDRQVVFENPAHDFPQRIIYRLDGEGVLRARIEGLRDQRLVGVDFPMRRSACESGSRVDARP
jgi:hypothetical protein